MDNIKLKRILNLVSVFTITLGMMVILGWVFDIQILKTVLPGYASMKINTALSFVLVGIAFSFIINDKWNNYSKLLSVILVLFGIASISQNVFDLNFGIDQFLINDKDAIDSSSLNPGRPSPSTALCFTLIGFAFFGICSKNNGVKITAQFFLHLVTVISFTAIMGYLFNVPVFYKLSFLTSMAVHTAFTFFILSLAASFLQKNIGLTGLFSGKNIGNIMARKLFPRILFAILILGFLRMMTHRNNMVSEEFGVALLTMSFILVSLYLIWSSAQMLNKLDLKRRDAEDEVILINKNLESIVIKRTWELEQTNRELEISRDLFQKIFSLNTAGMTLSAAEGGRKFVDVNDRFTEFLGYQKEEVIGKNGSEVKLMTEEERSRIYSLLAVQKFLKNEETVILTKSGALINALFSIDFFETNKKKYFISTFIDITERKKAEEKIRIISDYLAKQNKQLEDFANIVSHNLRGPVGNLKALLQFYKEEKLTERKEFFIDKLEITVNSLGNTLNELLEVITIKHDANRVKEKLNFNEIFLNIKELFDGQIIETNADITGDFSKAPEIEYSSIYLKSIIQNLLSNSLKYRSPDRSPVIHFETDYINNMIQLTVSDNGLGIDLIAIGHRLFGFQNTFHEHKDAKGVGLFITKVQVESMGGEITAKSEVNKGTTFTIIFNKNISHNDTN